MSVLQDMITASNEESVEDPDLEEEIEDSKLDFQTIHNEVKTATQEAISLKTINAYRRYVIYSSLSQTYYLFFINISLWNKFQQYVYDNIDNVGNEGDKGLDPPCEEVPSWICAWIFINCDIPDKSSGSRSYCQNKTFSQALKMRAAISFHYNETGRGSDHWRQNSDGSWIGNPSLSHSVSRYMLSLQRRKVS